MNSFGQITWQNIRCILGLKRCTTLLVESIQDMGGSIFNHDRMLGAIFPGFVWILIESHWNYQWIQM